MRLLSGWMIAGIRYEGICRNMWLNGTDGIPEERFEILFFEIGTKHSGTDRFALIRRKVTESAPRYMDGNAIFFEKLFFKFIEGMAVLHYYGNACPEEIFFCSVDCLGRLDTGFSSGGIFLVELCLGTPLCPIFPVGNPDLCRREKIHLIEVLLLAEIHGFLLQIIQIGLGDMMLVSGHGIPGPFHEILQGNVQLPYTVQHDVNMNIPGRIMTVFVGADDQLMTGKILSGKGHSKLLCLLRRETVFIPVPRIETDDVVMRFDFGAGLIFSVTGIHRLAFFLKAVGTAVDTVQQIEITGNLIAMLVENCLVCEFIVLHGEVIHGCVIVGIFDCNVLNNRHDIHLPFP